jgi:hypothetical protein
MATDCGTAHDDARQSPAWPHAPVHREALVRMCLDVCAQGALCFSLWFLC